MQNDFIEDAQVLEDNNGFEDNGSETNTGGPGVSGDINKLDDYDFKRLKEVFALRNSATNDIVTKAHIERDLKRITEKINTILDSADEKQTALLKEFEEKYGQIRINPEDGSYILN